MGREGSPRADDSRSRLYGASIPGGIANILGIHERGAAVRQSGIPQDFAFFAAFDLPEAFKATA